MALNFGLIIRSGFESSVGHFDQLTVAVVHNWSVLTGYPGRPAFLPVIIWI